MCLIFLQAQEKMQDKEKLNRDLKEACEKYRSDCKKYIEENRTQQRQAEDERQHSVELLSKTAVLENMVRQLEVKLDKEQCQHKNYRESLCFLSIVCHIYSSSSKFISFIFY